MEVLLGHHHTASLVVTRPAKHLLLSYIGDHRILRQRAMDSHLAESLNLAGSETAGSWPASGDSATSLSRTDCQLLP